MATSALVLELVHGTTNTAATQPSGVCKRAMLKEKACHFGLITVYPIRAAHAAFSCGVTLQWGNRRVGHQGFLRGEMGSSSCIARQAGRDCAR